MADENEEEFEELSNSEYLRDPDGMVRVKWDTPDPDTGEDVTENGLAPHLSLRLL